MQADLSASIAALVERGAAEGVAGRELAAEVGAQLLGRLGLPRPDVALFAAVGAAGGSVGEVGGIDDVVDDVVKAGVEPARVLGQVYEASIGRRDRRRRGAFYTPPAVAHGFVRFALTDAAPPLAGSGAFVACDPSVGAGAFLLAVADVLAHRGIDRSEIVRSLLWGIDLDPDSVEVTRAALAVWAGGGGAEPGSHLQVGDALADSLDAFENRFDLVVGNPPFQSQLGAATARSKENRAALIDRFGPAAKGYADTAALFLLRALDLVAPRGRVALVQPTSTLVAAHAERTRRALTARGRPRGLWLGGTGVFPAAAVSVCGVVVESGGAEVALHRATGAAVTPASTLADPGAMLGDDTWSDAVADLRGLPPLRVDTAGELGAWVQPTAGFRDEFYGLVPFVHEAEWAERRAVRPGRPRLITTGLVDPLHCRWGRTPTRFAGTRYDAPVLDMAALEADNPTLGRWVRDRAVPKLLLATQSRVIEVIIDEDGVLVPSVPVVSIAVADDRLWESAAVLCAPPVTLWALRHHGGSALTEDTIKLSATQVRSIPLPADRAALARAATLVRATAAADGTPAKWGRLLGELGIAMSEAYGVEDPVGLTQWWIQRFPRRHLAAFEKSSAKSP